MSRTFKNLDWKNKRFGELSRDELFNILHVRQAVFVVEQTCAYPDIDLLDKHAWHFTGWTNTGEIAAYARILSPGLKHRQPSFGRVLTTEQFRGSGLGEELMRRTLELMQQLFPDQPIKIGAQHHLQQFYQRLGFVSISEPYDEDGIAHIDMLRG